MRGQIWEDLKYALRSWRFPAAIIGVMFSLMSGAHMQNSAIETYLTGSDFGPLMILCAALPMGDAVAEDFRCRRITVLCLKLGIRQYAVSKFVAVFVAAFLTVFLGIAGCFLYWSTKLPIWVKVWGDFDVCNGYYLREMLLAGNSIGYMFCHAAGTATLNAMLVLYALTLSVWVHDKLIVHFMPIMIFYVACFLFWASGIPYYFSAERLMYGMATDGLPLGAAFAINTLFPGACALLVMIKGVRRTIGYV
ncbi:MAG: hypothetical protein RSG50_00840 [Clostridia bacterium]